MSSSTINETEVISTARLVAPILFDPKRYHKISIYNQEWSIKNFKNGAVRAVDIGKYRYITQNPLSPSQWGQKAQEGNKIIWVMNKPTKKWVLRLENNNPVIL